MGKKKNKTEDNDRNSIVDDNESDVPDQVDEEWMLKYGPPRHYEPYFHGPVLDRTLTDVACLMVFILCMIVWLAIALVAFLEGNPASLVLPADNKGRTCGVDPDVSDKPYLFYFNIVDCLQVETITDLNCPTTQVCLEECPDYSYFPLNKEPRAEFDLICLDAETLDSKKLSFDEKKDLIERQECAPYILESRPVYGRCIPSFLLTVDLNGSDFDLQTNIIDELEKSQFAETGITAVSVQLLKRAVAFVLNFGSILQVIYDDFLTAWYIIILGLLLGAILSFAWCYALKRITGLMVWCSILALHVLLAGGIFFCWYEYMELEGVPGAQDSFSLSLDLDSYLRLQKTWQYAGFVLCGLLFICILLTLCLCTRIKIAIALIEEASKAVTETPSVLAWPFFAFSCQLVLTILWATIAVFLATSKVQTFVVAYADGPVFHPLENITLNNTNYCNPVTFPNDTSAECIFNSYELPEYHNYMQIINLFIFLWGLNFIVGLSQVTLAGVFAAYYWTIDKDKDLPKFPLLRSFYWTILYHAGSCAFGALIITIVQVIRIILEYVEVKVKGSDNGCAKFCLRCLKCIFWCLEKFLKFINKNAYIMIAIYGKNFCTSARNAFSLLMRNIIRVAVVNKITDFLLFVGMAAVTTAVVVLAFFFFTFSAEFSFSAFVVSEYLPIPNVRYYWMIIFMIGLGTFVVANIFFSVFNMAVDTLFLSFLEDLERHDGTPEKPYYMNKDLMEIVGKKNKRHRNVEVW